MIDQPRKQPSLRDVAKRLGCSHSSLSEQIHRGDLSRGFAIRDGRIVVTDARALMDAWNGIPARRTAEAIVLYDRHYDRQVTALELFAERDMLALLVAALTAELRHTKSLPDRIAARLRAVAEMHGADDEGIARAEAELKSVLTMLREYTAEEIGG